MLIPMQSDVALSRSVVLRAKIQRALLDELMFTLSCGEPAVQPLPEQLQLMVPGLKVSYFFLLFPTFWDLSYFFLLWGQIPTFSYFFRILPNLSPKNAVFVRKKIFGLASLGIIFHTQILSTLIV